MIIIGIVYEAPSIRNLLAPQTQQEILTEGILIGLAFSTVKTGDLITNLTVFQVYYQPVNTSTGDLAGLATGYYGKQVSTISASHILELDNFVDADAFFNQPALGTGEKSLEFSKEIADGELLDIGFSFFMKEGLLSHISGSSHLIISGAKLIPGDNGVQISDPVIKTAYFNLKAQAIKKTGAVIAPTYKKGNIIGLKTTLTGRPCPPAWS